VPGRAKPDPADDLWLGRVHLRPFATANSADWKQAA
jgi:hypothetical protein